MSKMLQRCKRQIIFIKNDTRFTVIVIVICHALSTRDGLAIEQFGVIPGGPVGFLGPLYVKFNQ